MEQKNSPKKKSVSVLAVQISICAFCVAAVVVMRWFIPAWFQAVRLEYQTWFDAVQDEPPAVRFASALLDAFFIRAEAARAAPEGCSNKTYLPEQDAVTPVQDYYVSSEYGWRIHPISGEQSFHNGVDLACPEGSAIVAAMAGMVQTTGCDTLNGNYIVLRHSDGVVTSYCHMQFIFAREGEFVAVGEQIGTVGQTGSATGPHLHFCLKHDGIRYDPSAMLDL